jgi:hypothetical protein
MEEAARKESFQTPPVGDTRSRRQLPWWLPRQLLVAAALIAAAAFVAARQEPRPDPFANPPVTSLDWWRYPIERNAFKRLPSVSVVGSWVESWVGRA